jgi:hypothetical protein
MFIKGSTRISWGCLVFNVTFQIFQLYCGGQFNRRNRSTGVTDKLYQIMLYRVHFAMSGIRTDNVVQAVVHPTTIRPTTTTPALG